jgi:tetraacyldisaccharide 4'-kinase
MRTWHVLHDAWWRLATQHHPQSFSDALTCHALQMGSIPFRAAVRLRNLAYDRGWVKPVALPCPVVSVGNLTVGGTGKTACVELIAKKLASQGRQVCVLSRGYGGSRRDYWLRAEAGELLIDGRREGTREGLADEPQLLARRLEGVPVVVGARRDRTGRWACERLQPDVIILDDGFQHRRLGRACDIVLVQARMPFGGWPLLPRGPMREPLSSLRRAHIVIITKADEALERLGAISDRLRALAPQAVLVSAVHEPQSLIDVATGARQEPSRLAGRRVALVSSIGDPEGFEATVRRLQAAVSWHWTLPDHYRYVPQDWDVLRARLEGAGLDAVVTTEKDWVRLRPCSVGRQSLAVPLRVLSVRMKLLMGEDELDARLAAVRPGKDGRGAALPSAA